MHFVGVVSIHSIGGAIVVIVRFSFEFNFPKLVIQIFQGSVSIYGRRR